MSETVERAIAALVAKTNGGPNCQSDRCMCENAIERWQCVLNCTPEELARAVIEAMREPTQAMVDAVYEQADPGFCDEPGDPTPPEEVWEIMIDEALK